MQACAAGYALTYVTSGNWSQTQRYFTTGGLPPITSSWRQAPSGSRS
jgi:hypothetical protein